MDRQVELDPNHASQAPYNFVPLNDKVVAVNEEDLPLRDRFHPDRLSGVINCHLTTKSPLYIRGEEEGIFFTHGDAQRPAIPGSSLRGMIRNIVEIITYSKIQPVTHNNLFYRDVAGGNRSLNYRSNFAGVQAGILQIIDGEYEILPCDWLKVSHDLLKTTGLSHYYESKGRTGHTRDFPRWDYVGAPVQYRPVWVDMSAVVNDKATAVAFSAASLSGSTIRAGKLLITGDIPGKNHEYIFLPRPATPPVDDPSVTAAVKAMETDDQLSEWQQTAYPVDKPHAGARSKPGGLGTVALEIQSIQTFTPSRYLELFHGDRWHSALAEQTPQTIRDDFEHYMENMLQLDRDDYSKQDRLQDLLDLLRYPGVAENETAYIQPQTAKQEGLDQLLLPAAGDVYEAFRLRSPQAAQQEPRILRISQLVETVVVEPDFGEEIYVKFSAAYDNLQQDDINFEAWIDEEDRGGYGWRATIGQKITCIVLEVDEEGMYVRLKLKR